MNDELSITGLDAAEVLHGLYHGAQPLGPFGALNDQPGFTVDDARKLLERQTHNGIAYFDWVSGRPLKVEFNLGKQTIDTRLYDRDAGPGSAARVVQELRDYGRDRSKREG